MQSIVQKLAHKEEDLKGKMYDLYYNSFKIIKRKRRINEGQRRKIENKEN